MPSFQTQTYFQLLPADPDICVCDRFRPKNPIRYNIIRSEMHSFVINLQFCDLVREEIRNA